MPRQHGAEMPDAPQPFVVINVVKRSAMNKSKKRPGLAHILKNHLQNHQPQLFSTALDSEDI